MRGKDCRVFRVYDWNRWDRAQALCTQRRRFSWNPISPLAGDMSAKQTEGGMVPHVSSARILGRVHPPLSPTVTSPPQGGRLGGAPSHFVILGPRAEDPFREPSAHCRIGRHRAARTSPPPGGGECEFQHLSVSSGLKIPGEGVCFGAGMFPSPEKSMTWRCAPRS